MRGASISLSPMQYLTVPMRPQRRWSASRRCFTRKAVVVLPFVPVTPMTLSLSAGLPWKAAAISAMAARASGTRIRGDAQAGKAASETMATAPFSAACATNWAPSVRAPRNAKNSVPGPAPPRIVAKRFDPRLRVGVRFNNFGGVKKLQKRFAHCRNFVASLCPSATGRLAVAPGAGTRSR